MVITVIIFLISIVPLIVLNIFGIIKNKKLYEENIALYKLIIKYCHKEPE